MSVYKEIRLIHAYATVAAAATYTGPWIDVSTGLGFSCFVKWTQTAGAGNHATMAFQYTQVPTWKNNDYVPTESGYTYYEQYTIFANLAAPSATGASGKFLDFTTYPNLSILDRPVGSVRALFTANGADCTDIYVWLACNAGKAR